MATEIRYEKVVEDDYNWVLILFFAFILILNFIVILMFWDYEEVSIFLFVVAVLDVFSILIVLVVTYQYYNECRNVYWRKIP